MSDQTAEQQAAANLVIADLFVSIQRKAIETSDERVQGLADAAFSLLDDTMLKAVLMQRAEMQQDQPSVNPHVARLLRGNR